MRAIHQKFFANWRDCTREDAIDALWTAVEDHVESELLSYMGAPIRLLGWLDDSYDETFRTPDYCRSIETDYWKRNSTFVLLVLVAEGEEL
jgi:hypothetical protein